VLAMVQVRARFWLKEKKPWNTSINLWDAVWLIAGSVALYSLYCFQKFTV
jgi:hypothetical protein